MTPERGSPMPRPPGVFTPELLKTFVTLVRVDGSVTRTAELLNINEASVSKRIKPLHEGHAPLLPRPWLEQHGKLLRGTGAAGDGLCRPVLHRCAVGRALRGHADSARRRCRLAWASGSAALQGWLAEPVASRHGSRRLASSAGVWARRPGRGDGAIV